MDNKASFVEMTLDEGNESNILKVALLQPHGARDGQGEEGSNIDRNPFGCIQQAAPDRLIGTVEVKDEKTDEDGFIDGNRLAREIS